MNIFNFDFICFYIKKEIYDWNINFSNKTLKKNHKAIIK